MSLNPLFFLFIIITITIINSSPVCEPQSNFCQNCNYATNLCYKCQKPDILIPDENGGCIGAKKCFLGRNYCLECDINGNLCKTCEENYYKDENGGCTYSEGCEISYNGECLKCKEGFVLIGRENDFRFCKSLSIDNYKKCKEINKATGFCTECEEGYFLTGGDFKCVKIENCYEAIFGNCISCNDNYYYNKKEDKCEEKKDNFTHCKQSVDGKTCDICDENYYLDDNGVCLQTQFCSESKYLKCTKCRTGYYLSAYNVCTNTKNCDVVDMATSICTYCSYKYYLNKDDYTCKSNREDGPYKYCKQVVNGECVSCESSFYLGEDLQCSNSEFCIQAENGECKKCQEGYHLGLDKICTNIDKCIYSRYGICNECEDGYYYNQVNRSCVEMEDQFLNCKYSCEFEDKCCECKANYYLYENDSLCYDNTEEEEFIKCAYVNNMKEKCTRCEDGYFLGSEDNRCCKVEKCKYVENENRCFECDNFYCLDVKKQICIDNDYLEDVDNKQYINCNRTNEEGTACEICVDGYEVNDEGFCVDIDYCEKKEDGKCIKCKDILSPNEYEFCANEVFGCLESAHDNCLRCNNLENLYECTECKEGYKKNGQSCLSVE